MQLDQVIQQNASASEEMASTAEELISQSEQLQDLIAFFRLSADERRGGARRHGKYAEQNRRQEWSPYRLGQ